MLLVYSAVPCKTTYINEPVDVYVGQYDNGRTAIQLQSENGHPFAMLTVNLTQAHCGENEVYIKSYAENAGLAMWAAKAEIILPGIVGSKTSGYVTIHRFNLHPKFIAAITGDKE
jgi:hypothetical protein